jgi:hypothetical protein
MLNCGTCLTGSCGANNQCTGPYVVGGPSVGALYVADDLVVSVNGTQVYSDLGHGPGNRTPLTLSVVPNDQVIMSFYDTIGGSKDHDQVWLSGPGVALQMLEAGFAGAGSSYPADALQPYDILVFTVPAAGGAAALGCLPDVPLNTATWTLSPYLVINQATTKVYNVTWTVDSHVYNYTPDCNGWINDDFIASDGSWATVWWNTITHEMQTYPVSGQTYNAMTDAQWAVSTTFPAGDLGLLTIH